MPEHKDRIDLVLSIGTPDIYWNCDGLIAITNSAFRVALISPTGDCPAVLYYYQGSEMKFGIRAVVHSGWKGTSLNIAAKCVRGIAGIYNQLAELHKARTEFSHSNLICAVWDGICKKCYTVTPEMNAVFPDDYDNGHLGLADIIVKQLETAGVASSNILRSRICPHCETDLFGRRIFASYRGGDENFRNALVISA